MLVAVTKPGIEVGTTNRFPQKEKEVTSKAVSNSLAESFPRNAEANEWPGSHSRISLWNCCQ